jgi:hypothetical protein
MRAVLIGADVSGNEELLASRVAGGRASPSWRELLLRLRDENGLVLAPELATGDEALGSGKRCTSPIPGSRDVGFTRPPT